MITLHFIYNRSTNMNYFIYTSQKNNLLVHAEANAVLLKGTANLENATAFVTLFPCEDCAKMLIQVSRELCHALSFIVLGT